MNIIENIKRIKEVMGLKQEDEKPSQFDAVLVGGLDYRKDKNGKLVDKTLDEQVGLLKQGLGNNKKVMGFKYNVDVNTVLNFLERNPYVKVYLFSKGCDLAEDISGSGLINNNKIYIIEPYAISSNTTRIVQNAVGNGVPSENVFVGSSQGRGLGIISTASKTNVSSHWDALTFVGSITS